MSYNLTHVALVSHLKKLAQLTIDSVNSLNTKIQTLSARYDANVKASTDSSADYAAEVVDARVDTWGGEHGSLGANIRDGQQSEKLERLESDGTLQTQLQTLSEAVLKQAVMIAEIRETLQELKKGR